MFCIEYQKCLALEKGASKSTVQFRSRFAYRGSGVNGSLSEVGVVQLDESVDQENGLAGIPTQMKLDQQSTQHWLSFSAPLFGQAKKEKRM